MYFLKHYKSEVNNASKTLAQNVTISELITKSTSLGLTKQLGNIKFPSANFWDFGVRAAKHLAKGDFVMIVCKSTVYITEILEKIDDDNGELGGLLAWDFIFGRPWTNPFVLHVRSIIPLSAEIQMMIDCAEEPVAKNFHPISSSLVKNLFSN